MNRRDSVDRAGAEIGIIDISINVLELLGMVIPAWVPRAGRLVVCCCGEITRQPWSGCDGVGGSRQPRSGALVRFRRVVKMSSGWAFDAMRVPGVFNDVADGNSRWDKSTAHANLVRTTPYIPWRARELGRNGKYLCTSVFASNSSETPLRPGLSVLTKSFFGFVSGISPDLWCLSRCFLSYREKKKNNAECVPPVGGMRGVRGGNDQVTSPDRREAICQLSSYFTDRLGV